MTKQSPATGPSGAPGNGRRDAEKAKKWQRTPDPHTKDEKLDEALEETFPASDPPQPAQPGVTGWDADDEAVKKAGGKR